MNSEDLKDREFVVSDDKLRKLWRITFKSIREVCEPVLKENGFTIKAMGLDWVTLSPDFPFNGEYRVFKTDNGLALYVFNCEKGGHLYRVIYHLFGKLLHVMMPGECEVVSTIEHEKLQMNLCYEFGEQATDISRYVNRYSRIYQVKHSWFIKGPYLDVICDRVVRKEAYIKTEDKISAFENCFLFSEKISDYEPFEFSL